MIISVSRRTDIPAFYSKWFFNRIKEGYVLVPNPYNPKMISRVSLDPAVVDCIVFWTKNPNPMIEQFDRLKDYKYYFQFTLNPYGKDIENHLPSVQKRINIFKRLTAEYNNRKHDVNSPMLIGNVTEEDIIKDRVMRSLRNDQFSLF